MVQVLDIGVLVDIRSMGEKMEEKEIIISEKEIKIFYRLVNNKFEGFHHLESKIDDTYYEIEKEEFDSLLSLGGEIYYNMKELKLKALLLEENSGFIKPTIDCELGVYVESATKEEINIYLENNTKKLKNRIVFLSDKLESLNRSGLSGDKEYFELEKELEDTKKEYLDVNHELGLNIDKIK